MVHDNCNPAFSSGNVVNDHFHVRYNRVWKGGSESRITG